MMFTQISFHWFAISKQRASSKDVFFTNNSPGGPHTCHMIEAIENTLAFSLRGPEGWQSFGFFCFTEPFSSGVKKKHQFTPKRSVFANVNHFRIFGASCFFYCKFMENRIIPLLVVGFAP